MNFNSAIYQIGPLVLIVAFALGCDDTATSETETETNPFQSVQITVAVPGGYDFADRWQAALEEWSSLTEASVELTEYELQDGKPLSEAWPADATPDVILYPTIRAAELDDAGLLAPMPASIRKNLDLKWLDYFDGVRKYMTPLQRDPAIVPAGAPVLVCYYRRDLFEAANISPPDTWADYLKLIQTVDEWGGGLPAVEPWSESFRATMFLARSASAVKHRGFFSTLFDIETGAPLIATKGYQKTLDDVVAGMEQLPGEVLNYSPADCRRLILSGKAAMAITLETGDGNPDLLFTSSDEKDNSEPWTRPEAVSIGVCRLPGSVKAFNRSTSEFEEPADGSANNVGYTGFAGLSMGVTIADDNVKRSAAWNLLVTMISEPDYSKVFASGRRQLCRSSQILQPHMWVGEELADEADDYVAAVQKSLRGTQVIKELPVIGANRFRAALTAGLGKALSKESPPTDALRSIEKEWTSICEDLGKDRVRNSYRRSLGLTEK